MYVDLERKEIRLVTDEDVQAFLRYAMAVRVRVPTASTRCGPGLVRARRKPAAESETPRAAVGSSARGFGKGSPV
jgi:hypothetical protein